MATEYSSLKGQQVNDRVGRLGKVDDILFDDQSWKVRYVVVDDSSLLMRKKFILTTCQIDATKLASMGEWHASVERSAVEQSPPLPSSAVVSRRYEAELYEYFDLEPYWMGRKDFVIPFPETARRSATAISNGESNAQADFIRDRSQQFGGHLRSLKDIRGYGIHTADDEEFGRVEDAMIDLEDWYVLDLVLSSHKWLPGGKHVAYSPLFIEDIDEADRMLRVEHDKAAFMEMKEFSHQSYDDFLRKVLIKDFMAADADDHRI